MKQILKETLFVLTILLLLPLTASADAIEIDGIWYSLVNKAKIAEVTKDPSDSYFSGSYSGNIVIPSIINYEGINYNVTSIGDNAFGSCSELYSIIIPNSITDIGNYAFSGCSNLSSVELSNGLKTIGVEAFKNCESLVSLIVPESVESIKGMAFYGCNHLKYILLSSSMTEIEFGLFYMCTSLKAISIPNGVTFLKDNIFGYCESLTEITFPNSVELLWHDVASNCPHLKTIIIGAGIQTIQTNSFANCDELTDVYCFAESVPTTENDAFENSYVDYATLHVPASAISTYSASAPWSGFGNIVPITSEDITIGDLGIGTFCGSNPIDFTGIEDIKAYVVSSYDSGTGLVTLTRTYYVPPFTGVVVKGNKGVHTIPAGVGQPVYPNMMKGVTTNTALAKVNGDYTNYVLANKGGNLGFYAVSDGSTLGAGKAYLPLPTADLPSSSARGLILNFDDEDVTAINSAKIQQPVENGQYYDLQGRRVDNPTSGLYIVNGKKVIIK